MSVPKILPDNSPFPDNDGPAEGSGPAQAPADRKGHFMKGAGDGAGAEAGGAEAAGGEAGLGELAEVAAVAAL